MNLTEHFTLEELIASETAARKGIDNTPSPAILENLKILARHLEAIRLAVGKPIHVNSGYRCEELNVAVGGQKNSAHRFGLAADIVCPGFGAPLALCRAISVMPDIPYDQVIYEFGPKGWCHVGFTPQTLATPRREALTITRAGKLSGFMEIT